MEVKRLYAPFFTVIAIMIMTHYITIIDSADVINQTAVVRLLGGLQPDKVLADGSWHRLIMYGFLHHGMEKYLSNMIGMIFVAAFEIKYGFIKTATIFLCSTFTGGIAIMIFSLPSSTTAGASAGIYGIIGALIIMIIINRDEVHWFGRLYIWFVLTNGLYNTHTISNISKQGHYGGLFGGIIVMILLNRRYIYAGYKRSLNTIRAADAKLSS